MEAIKKIPACEEAMPFSIGGIRGSGRPQQRGSILLERFGSRAQQGIGGDLRGAGSAQQRLPGLLLLNVILEKLQTLSRRLELLIYLRRLQARKLFCLCLLIEKVLL